MSKENNGGPAFPIFNQEGFPSHNSVLDENRCSGVTIRDYLAARSMQGIRAGIYKTGGAYPSESRLWSSDEAARQAYLDADAMLKEREK